MIDASRTRRESMRWCILLALNTSRPINPHETAVLAVVQGIYPDATPNELRRELDYLEARSMITVDKLPHGAWICSLTSLGIDIAEYTVDCRPGIARPQKYWSA